ncbi:Uncharacterised protein [Bacteroides heparinolyticus]|uniref:Uncharacterized protein n=1 Tax=Prevotella heparinolytica TaxID=28113 RepID=A0A449I252_9BACE|nr:Uncharacterised protein [Bacteroides heparinolyticus]
MEKKDRKREQIQFLIGFFIVYIAIKYGYPLLKQWLF